MSNRLCASSALELYYIRAKFGLENIKDRKGRISGVEMYEYSSLFGLLLINVLAKPTPFIGQREIRL